MRGTLHGHIRSNIVGYLVLFGIAMTATAGAADGPLPGQNTVGSEDIIGNEVKSDDIGNGRIFNVDFADDVIQTGKIQDGTLTGVDVANNNLTNLDIATGTLFNGSLTGADIDESTLFNDNTLTANDLATDSVNAAELATDSVGGSEVINNSLTAADIGAGQVTSAEIPANAVRASELGPITVERTTEEVAAGEVESVTDICSGAGEIAIGGDAEIDGGPQSKMYASFPVDSTGFTPANGAAFKGWRGLFRHDGAGTATAIVTALCLED